MDEGSLSVPIHIITSRFHRYTPSMWRSAWAWHRESAKSKMYGFSWDFISSRMTAMQTVMRSKTSSWWRGGCACFTAMHGMYQLGNHRTEYYQFEFHNHLRQRTKRGQHVKWVFTPQLTSWGPQKQLIFEKHALIKWMGVSLMKKSISGRVKWEWTKLGNRGRCEEKGRAIGDLEPVVEELGREEIKNGMQLLPGIETLNCIEQNSPGKTLIAVVQILWLTIVLYCTVVALEQTETKCNEREDLLKSKLYPEYTLSRWVRWFLENWKPDSCEKKDRSYHLW